MLNGANQMSRARARARIPSALAPIAPAPGKYLVCLYLGITPYQLRISGRDHGRDTMS